jgi:argininosuccinate lyase
MSNSTNLNKMSWIIDRLWDLEVRELDLGRADTLTAVLNELKQIKKEMIVEREARLKRMEEDAKGQIEKWVREQGWVRRGEGGEGR